MAVKEPTKTEVAQNGHAPILPQARQMNDFQQKHFRKLLHNFDRARDAVSYAQNAANDFVLSCAEDQGVTLGKDGWTFDDEAMEFICLPPKPQGKAEKES